MNIHKSITLRLVIVSLGMILAVQASAEGDPLSGRAKAHMCVGCHNIPDYAISFPERYKVPKIQGQSFDYIKYALTEYANGTRYTPVLNRLASMPAIAASLTEQDIEDLASYYSSLNQ